jgi:general secretion pathway protein A
MINGAGHQPAALDLDLTGVAIDADTAQGLADQLAGLDAAGQGDRLARLEQSLARLERINTQTLGLLQSLIDALKKPGAPQ